MPHRNASRVPLSGSGDPWVDCKEESDVEEVETKVFRARQRYARRMRQQRKDMIRPFCEHDANNWIAINVKAALNQGHSSNTWRTEYRHHYRNNQ